MRPAPLGWLVLLALACALVLSSIAGLEIQETRRVRAHMTDRVDSLVQTMVNGRCVWITPRDTVRRPIRK